MNKVGSSPARRSASLIAALFLLTRPLIAQTPHNPALSQYDLAADTPRSFSLPAELREISGLASTADGRLFTHNDEQGVVMEIATASGLVTKRFFVGGKTLRQDFEGLAIAGQDFFLVTSDGRLYRFREGKDGAIVPVERFSTGLKPSHNVEGLCYDPGTHSLLLACKDPGPGIGRRMRAVFSFSLQSLTLDPRPRFLINADSIAHALGLESFNPSGIERHPETGSFFLLSAKDPAVVELNGTGSVIAASRLPRDILPQPEGIAFGLDLSLWIGSEGKKRGRIAVYVRRGG
jgi:uncharacterized protein YjiK